MHLLVLGYSDIVRRRVLPAARACAAIERITIASRRHGTVAAGAEPDDVAWFADYDEALAASGADAVYVSGPNDVHRPWAMRALARGLHVAVDKPAFLDLHAAREAAALAATQGCVLAEATVFAFHPQIAEIRRLLADTDPGTIRATAWLCIPPLPADDFRYRVEHGGGSLSDLGPYAVATNRLLFGQAPATVHCDVLSRTAVDTAFSVLLTHRSGGALIGHFGFTSAYMNRLSILTSERSLDIDRIFTTPPELPNTLRVRASQGEQATTMPAGDAFVNFLDAFAEAIRTRTPGPLASALLDDAALLERLRRHAGD